MGTRKKLVSFRFFELTCERLAFLVADLRQRTLYRASQISATNIVENLIADACRKAMDEKKDRDMREDNSDLKSTKKSVKK